MLKNKIKKLLTSVSLAFVMICSSIAVMPATPVSAAADGIYFYQDGTFSGDWFRIDPTTHAYYNSSGKEISVTYGLVPNGFNDSISSIKIVGNYQIMVFENTSSNWYTDGKARLFQKSVADPWNYGMNDNISSFEIESLNSPGLYIYSGANQAGNCMKLDQYNTIYYDQCPRLNKYGFDNSISSIMYIKPSSDYYVNTMTVSFYKDNNYSNTKCNVTLNFLVDGFNINYACANIPSSMNDQASSLKVIH